MLRTFCEVRDRARRYGRKFVAIPAADDETSIEAAVEARKDGLAESILIGDGDTIRGLLKARGVSIGDFDIVHCADTREAAFIAAGLVRRGKADMILKGHIDTPVLMKALLDKERGLRSAGLFSDIFVFEDPSWDDRGGRLMAITDGGVTPAPTLEQKRSILENAVQVFHKLGKACPNVAVMSGTEKVSEKIRSTTDARALVEMNRAAEIKGCLVEGPMALDVAAHGWCAEKKGIDSKMAGEVDIMLMPNFEAGNMVAKTFVFYMNRKIGHTIMGSEVPVLINSRTDSSDLKLNSIALSIVVSK